MKLDPRIKSIDSIRSFNTNNDDCLGKFGYFTNYVTNFDDLNSIRKGICVFKDGSRFPFHADSIESQKFQFFIPESELLPKEKQYRPCTLDEFGLHIGDLIKFRKKDDHAFEIGTMYMGYIKTSGIVKVLLGQCYYSLDELFNEYEWFDKDSNTWEMFGVEE